MISAADAIKLGAQLGDEYLDQVVDVKVRDAVRRGEREVELCVGSVYNSEIRLNAYETQAVDRLRELGYDVTFDSKTRVVGPDETHQYKEYVMRIKW